MKWAPTRDAPTGSVGGGEPIREASPPRQGSARLGAVLLWPLRFQSRVFSHEFSAILFEHTRGSDPRGSGHACSSCRKTTGRTSTLESTRSGVRSPGQTATRPRTPDGTRAGATFALTTNFNAMAIAQTLGQPNGPYRCQHCLRLFTRAEEAEYRRTALALLADQQNSLKPYTSDGIADDGSI